ncbi:MAG: D-xylose ABC transporter ATP-binding protein [Rhodospirillaceae bacterium]|nr:D-xylose ABC transporter ATP-binding protein [Rhodospirillaceae bacterium]
MGQPILELRNIYKAFPGVTALDNVDFDVLGGEVHVLLGENGAGKSTLIKIIAGTEQKDNGDFIFEQKAVEKHTPFLMREMGISVIHQELSLVRLMDVKSNLFLGRDLKKKNWLLSKFGIRDDAGMVNHCKQVFSELGINLDPNKSVMELTLSQMQLVEIAKAVAFDSKVILMDEPTSSLGPEEKDQLFRVIERLKRRKIGIVYVSHILEDCMAIGNKISVLRDGQLVANIDANDAEIDTLIKLMTGRTFQERYPKISGIIGETILEVRNFNKEGVFENINFSIKKGEIIGFAGLVGARRTDLLRAVFGLEEINAGKVFINSKEVKLTKPRDAIRLGLTFLTEDRKNQGIFPLLTVLENLLISRFNFRNKSEKLRLTNNIGYINISNAYKISDEYVQKLGVKVSSLADKISQLSGGNQQKVLLARGISTHASVLILDEPTKGVDAGGKVEIYRIIEDLAKSGVAIIVISSELPEVAAICTRIIVMNDGRITGEIPREQANPETIMRYATS